jgi:hypothetical protein
LIIFKNTTENMNGILEFPILVLTFTVNTKLV